MATVKKAQAGIKTKLKFDEVAYMKENKRRADSMRKEFEATNKALAEAEKNKIKNSYTNERINKVLGKKTSYKKGGNIKPKASNVSKKLGSAKKSIGNMRFAKKKK